MVRFTIPGEPTGKARPRVTKWGVYTPEKTVLYENLVKTCYDGPMMEGPLSMEIIAYYQIAKSASKKQQQAMRELKILPTKKPDCDNVIKIIADALNNIAYKDDSQIVIAKILKRYSDNPRVEVELEEIE
jgi:Holliday junction resolvase RusA-like endonuclease